MKYFSPKSLLLVLPLFIFCASSTIVLILAPPANVLRCAIFIISCYVVTLILAASFGNYPRLTDKGLEIRNIIFRFQCKTYIYGDIEKVVFCCSPKHSDLRIYLKSAANPVQHSIDAMPERLKAEFLEELRQHGVGMERAEKPAKQEKAHSHRGNYFSTAVPIIVCIVLIGALEGLFIALAILETRHAAIPLWIMGAFFTFFWFLIMAAILWGHPVLTDKELIIRNILYRSYKKRFEYNDIRKVEICHGGMIHFPCIRIYSNVLQRPTLYNIDCMSQNLIPDFLDELASKGVEVVRLLD